MATVHGSSRTTSLHLMVLHSCVLSSAMLFSFFGNQEAFAQSVSVGVPVFQSANVPFGSRNVQIPSGMNAQQRQWEEILNKKSPEGIRGEMPAEVLIERLRILGLPVVLDQSAKDDSLTEDEPVNLPAINAPLRTRLLVALHEKNATITFRENHIEIISLDDARYTEFLMTIIYDVTAMDPNRLEDTIYAVAPDSWMDTGQGLAMLEYYHLRGRDLLMVTQTYRNHPELQALLGSMARLTGMRSRDWARQSRASIAVRLPATVRVPIQRPPSRRLRQGGVGGLQGGAGGVF